MRKIGVVYGGCVQHHRTFNEPKYQQYIEDLIYFPEFAEASLDAYDVLLLPSQLHQGLMLQAKDKIREFADRGGIVVAFGPQSTEWFPGQKWEFRPTNFWWWLEKDAKSGLVQHNPDHNMFKYLTMADATWHQHGVFWPPEGSETLISLEEGGSVFYIDKVSTGGTLIMTTLDPDFHYGSYFMPATELFLDGFLPWLAEGDL
ncbi:hypothetical protein [Paenibacillus thalictri]|uniref:ThuA-like domain-containing protein n=1 Tax=Paenibacillus thalictri TaxID=2527873 RepID=A0A4Q9DN23_9BACL|nr:hypothetical protein [Paenibacillus thalictri]TBL77295.1 hypothetical protein EYB31_17585 [Paenibacillus thalictri]